MIEEPGGSERIWWEKNPRLDPAAFERLHEDVRGYLDAHERVRAGSVRRRGPGLPATGAVRHAERLARAVRAEHVHPGHAGGAGAVPSRVHGAARARLPGRSRAARHPHRHLHRAPLRQEAGADRRHPVRGRDEEVDLHRAQLSPSRRRACCRCTAPPTSARRATRRSSSGSRAPARRRSPPILPASSSATTSTAGATAACSTSRAAATPR